MTGGTNLEENYVGSHFENYDYYVVLSHFKGHSMAGYGGAIKNISIGIASAEGKSHIHSGGTGGSMWSGDQDAFLESMAEAGKSVVDYLDGNILYINVMNRLSVDCDCDRSPGGTGYARHRYPCILRPGGSWIRHVLTWSTAQRTEILL